MEQEIKYTTEKILTVEDLEEIMTTAIEGGIGYWACLDNTACDWLEARKQLREEGKELFWGTVATRVLLNGGAIVFEDAEGEDNECWMLTLEGFRRGCELYEKERGSLTKALEDGSFDADDADCLIQYGCFGQVIFG